MTWQRSLKGQADGDEGACELELRMDENGVFSPLRKAVEIPKSKTGTGPKGKCRYRGYGTDRVRYQICSSSLRGQTFVWIRIYKTVR